MNKKCHRCYYLILVSVWISFPSYGQHIQFKEGDAENLVNTSTYIFEATVISDTYEAYFKPDSTDAFGSFFLNVTRVYKGKLIPGTVEMNYSGASIEYYKNGELWKRQTYDSDIPVLRAGSRYIILAIDSDYPDNPTKPGKRQVDNTKTLRITNGRGGYIEWPSFGQETFIGPAHEKRFETEKDVYKFLRSFPEVSIPDDVYKNASTTNSFKKTERSKKKTQQ